MNRFVSLALLALIGMVASATADTIDGLQTAGTDLVANGGFDQLSGTIETWGGYEAAEWTNINGGAYGSVSFEKSSTGYVKDGTYALHLYMGKDGTGQVYQEHVYSDGFASDVSALRLSGWAVGQGGDWTAKIDLTTGYWDGTAVTDSVTKTWEITNVPTSWTNFTDKVAVRSGINYVKLNIAAPESAIVFDSISLTAVPEPGTLALIGSALIGLLAYAWRKRK